MIYLASPYTSPDTQKQIQRYKLARQAHDHLTAANVPVFSPIMIGHEMTKRGFRRDHAWWMQWCLQFLRQSNALYVLTIEDWDVSKGVAEEVRFAAARGLPIIAYDAFEECDTDITGAMIRRHFDAPPREPLARFLHTRDDHRD